MIYAVEQFTADEEDILRPYFTNLDRPTFALVNLPEVVKGALFARYSRSSKSLRRLFLDEFVGDLDVTGDLSIDASIGLQRAEQLYDTVFLEYGDDSVAQLGGVHLACEQASNLLTKILEWGRLMAYLEQSTRYIPYDSKLIGRYRYFRPPAILGSKLGAKYVADMDAMFDSYSSLLREMLEWARERYPKQASDSDFVHKQAVKAKACDAVRGLLPAASLSNVGIYGTGQAFEALLLRMRAHPLPEARAYADEMLEELRKVIPSFLSRVERPERGGVWVDYLRSTREATSDVVEKLIADLDAGDDPSVFELELGERPEVELIDWDPDGETKVLAAICYPHSQLPESVLLERVRRLGADERATLLHAYVGDRANRRHKPGRAFERTAYRFDILGDYGAFRDLQRHRMLTIEWQSLTPEHGYEVPPPIDEAGFGDAYDATMTRSAELYDALAADFPEEAAYAVSLSYRIRYAMQMNAREAMHMIELRSAPQGHPTYRRIAQEMHRLIAERAGHRALAAAMVHVDHDQHELERLGSERAAEARRMQRAT
jgi:thymidylate synthase ThyX